MQYASYCSTCGCRISGLVEDASNSSSKGIIDREVNKRLAMKKDIRAESSNKFFRKDKSTTKSKIKLKCHYCNLVFDSRAQRLLHEQAWHQTR
jgi:ribosomal protein L44E